MRLYQILIVIVCFHFMMGNLKAQLSNPVGKMYDEGQLALATGTGTIADASANAGAAIIRTAGSESNTMWFGPYVNLQGGSYILQVRMKVASNASSNYLLFVDMVSNYGSNVYAHLDIYPNMFKASNEWQLFSIPVNLPDNVSNYEIRGMAFHGGVTDVYLDYVNLIPGNITGFYSNAFTVTGNGNVGIGTTTPTRALEIYNSSESSMALSTPNRRWGFATNGSWANGGFTIYDFSADNARLLINTSGYVGIGTINPTEKLSVNGNIKSKKLIVTQSGWADYVFKPTYKLKSLTEVEEYIKTHQHLPDVPTEKEIKENGVDIGDAQVLLLKKIEELTLYMIEIKKENKSLRSEVELLKSVIKKK